MTSIVAGEPSSGVSIRVALTTISSDSASAVSNPNVIASCARPVKGTAREKAAARSHERIRITSYLQLFREADLLPPARDIASTALILLFREEVFSSCQPAEGPRSTNRGYRFSSNEVETGKYSGFWLLGRLRVFC